MNHTRPEETMTTAACEENLKSTSSLPKVQLSMEPIQARSGPNPLVCSNSKNRGERSKRSHFLLNLNLNVFV